MFALKWVVAMRLAAQRAVLALLLVGSAGMASAAVYHVDIDTAGYDGFGSIDFVFGASDVDTPLSYASLSNFSGAYGDVLETSGAVSGSVASAVQFNTSGGYNDLYQAIVLGGKFSFNVVFSGPLLTTPGTGGSLFGVTLYDANGNAMGTSPFAVQFDLLQSASGAGTLSASADAGLANVSAVPEPAEWMMLLLGLALVGLVAQRRGAVGASLS